MFLVLFLFLPLVQFFGSFVVYCLRIFVLRVKLFLHIVELFSFDCYFRVNSWLYFTGPVYIFSFLVFVRPRVSYFPIILSSRLFQSLLQFALLLFI